jgi:hypothetical protein
MPAATVSHDTSASGSASPSAKRLLATSDTMSVRSPTVRRVADERLARRAEQHADYPTVPVAATTGKCASAPYRINARTDRS